ncbi:MAG: hypothetical protein HDT38_02850 [Clostridiales bacterium]|nr:hypothetical protein [Clostridiales bacterium]
MNEVEFDRALSDFLDDNECETASEAVYHLIRIAFAAGWNAAMKSDLKEVMDSGSGNRGGLAVRRTQKQLTSAL